MTQQAQVQEITYDLAASPGYARDGICFAACGSGLYRSQDGGVTWHNAYDALNLESPLPTLAVVVSPTFETDRTLFAGAAGGILRSFDGGKTWLTALLPAPPPVVSALVLSPGYANDGILLAGTVEDGVFRSADRGSHWEAWNFGLLDLDILCLAISPGFARDDTLFVGTETGIFRSTNGGRAWRETGFPTDHAPVLSLAMSPGYTQDSVLFAGTESSGLFRSGDQGRTWERVSQHAIADVVNAVLLSPEFPGRPHLLVMLDDVLLVSRDGGASWSEWKAGLRFEQGASCVVAPQGLDPDAPLLVGLAQGGVLKV
jgi:photosystem II stability/assembly factor-like uncharacterized protein